MRVWLDVYDADGNRLGEGPVFAVKSAQVRRALDGAGSIRANCVATDARALALLDVGKIIKLWGEDTGGVRLLGEGIISKWRLSEDQGGVGLIIDGPDILEELKRKNTLLGRIYNQDTVQDVCDDLIGLVPGWAVDVDGSIASDVIDARFDGVHVLKAFIEIAERYGFHVRTGEASRTLEIGPFGADSGLRVLKVETVNTEALSNPNLLMVQRIEQDRMQESNNYYTVIIPTGAGEGTAALTLAEATNNSPYAVQSLTGPDGATLYYLSTTTYPTGSYTDFRDDPAAVVKVGQFKAIAPLSNSDTDITNAANALYDAAANDLARASTVQETYGVTVKNVKQTIKPGDKVRIDYRAQVRIDDEDVTYLDVRDDFFVLKAVEQINLDGSDVVLEISNVDRFERDEAELVFNAIESMELRNLKPNISVGTPSTYVYTREIAPGFPALLPIEITDAVLELLRVRLRLVTGPFRATSQGGAAGGDHRHLVAEWSGGVTATPPGLYSSYTWSNDGLGTGTAVFKLGSSSGDIYTFGASGDHTHPAVFGITDDVQTPTAITIWFGGANVTSTLFGSVSLAPSGGAINALADAGALANLLINASGGLRQLHQLEIRCGSGRGRIEATVERFETTQAIRL